MKQIFVYIALAILVAGGFWAWQHQGPAAPNTHIKIGVIAPLTDAFAQYGEEVRKGISAAQGSSTVEFIFEDEKCDPKVAVSAFQKLTSVDGVNFIIGPGCGSPQEAVVPLLKDSGTLAVVASAASKELYTKSGGNFFDIQYSLEDESKFIAQQMEKVGYKKVALVTYGNSFSKTHADSFRANFHGIIAVNTVVVPDTANLLPVLTKIKAAGVDAIYAPDISFFFGDAAAKMHQLGMTTPVWSTYVAELPGVRPLVEGVTYSFPSDLTGSQGGVYELSKQAAETLIPLVTECKGEVSCVKNKMLSSGKFDEFGVSKRTIILKQIKNGQPVVL